MYADSIFTILKTAKHLQKVLATGEYAVTEMTMSLVVRKRDFKDLFDLYSRDKVAFKEQMIDLAWEYCGTIEDDPNDKWCIHLRPDLNIQIDSIEEYEDEIRVVFYTS